jgi:hypothetical protein
MLLLERNRTTRVSGKRCLSVCLSVLFFSFFRATVHRIGTGRYCTAKGRFAFWYSWLIRIPPDPGLSFPSSSRRAQHSVITRNRKRPFVGNLELRLHKPSRDVRVLVGTPQISNHDPSSLFPNTTGFPFLTHSSTCRLDLVGPENISDKHLPLATFPAPRKIRKRRSGGNGMGEKPSFFAIRLDRFPGS